MNLIIGPHMMAYFFHKLVFDMIKDVLKIYVNYGEIYSITIHLISINIECLVYVSN